MAAWLISALRLLAVGIAGGVGFEAGQRILPGPTGGVIDVFSETGFAGGSSRAPARLSVGGFPVVGRRRRRRRALTHQDKDDIAFLAATVGETTARKFALILAAHSSR